MIHVLLCPSSTTVVGLAETDMVETVFGMLMVYVAELSGLSFIPSLKALALIVVVLLTSIGPLYTVDVSDGMSPLVVYLIVAPFVMVFSETD